MPLPLFRVVEILEVKRSSIWAKLANAPIGKQPVAVDVRPAKELEYEALELVDEYLTKNKVRDFPYKLSVLTNLGEHPRLEVFKHWDDLPAFFKRKNRPLNMKENTLMAKVTLKQKNMENINIEEVEETISSYANKHKLLAKKQSYLNYLKQLSEELGM
ncbi:MAG: hypothetical protein CME64_00550 [Halobacteriovoraceae bacterium]|nr:hypothetical protein [Halobacteriovoraceae bacterium]|tara:strand:+ start:129172 stop:129648 length:477 start_codon:yes stop_codon:yes gene_type:complete